MSNNRVVIYTDGACSGNPGPGGWAARLIHPTTGQTRDLSGGEERTTNNRMELMAALEALQALKRPVTVELYSDSQYLVKAFKEGWLDRWRSNGWRTSGKKPVENQDLWERLLDAAAKHVVVWRYVEGHAGHEHNEACDQLAREQRDRFREKGA